MTTTATSTTTPAAALDPIPIEFNAARHEYRVRGLLFPSVTTILHELGAIDDRWFTEETCERGRRVHEATVALDYDLAGVGDFDPDIQGYLRSWLAFRETSKPEILAVEELVASIEYGYAGTLDRRVTLAKRESILDLKTGSRAPWIALQLAGYAATFPRPLKRYSVHLDAEGRPAQLIPYDDRNDIAVFRAGVLFANWLRKTA